ncbi:hypothetical protein E4U52_003185 [Claviceps spartinae]|nr:hypothetical protein E4U52_003185 [Claviceps spartinae]KAG6064627.1 hypothetical protein E4U32_008226 [Claviceps aff. humidiphila group G2b]KAG6073733.1 hypothetical protein E4U15_006325 [Claviceps sp. LM218 group G6]KAG6092941.1 hypothetical protein E4U30_004784 [Claviceps sp. LM220 group G6]KAG6103033.1 hypothetical protein E4U14_006471 [Claviceps sp. LM454 group G7]KAG6113414.1 hypothetical protein E4U31_000964 [Claviceps sp. LM219 group G6]
MGNCFSNPEYSNSTESTESVEKSYVKTSEGGSGTKTDLRGDVPYVDRDEPIGATAGPGPYTHYVYENT